MYSGRIPPNHCVQGGVKTSVRFGGIYVFMCSDRDVFVCSGRSEHKCEVWRDLHMFMCSDRDVFVCSGRSEHKCEVWRDLAVYVFR